MMIAASHQLLHLQNNHLHTSKIIFQPSIPRYATTTKITAIQRKEIDDALMLLFIKDFQPFSVVEDKGFRKFVSTLNPAYQLPSRKHISNTMLTAKYQKCENDVKERFNEVNAACLTVDGWTSRAQEGYFAITAHYIDDNFESKSALLQCRVLPGPHTRANISQDLQRVISQWNLNKKVRLVVADNAANVQNSIEELNLKNFGCFAHI
jgi:hypothetical protein